MQRAQPGGGAIRAADPAASGAISFEFLAEIASGASARVDLCRATDPAHRGQMLAVKRLHPHIAEDEEFANQFLDEVWMTAALKHPNVVEVAGWGNDEQGFYLAVELVQGVSLLRLMKTIFDTGEAFTERMVVYFASCICRGLSAAHALRAPSGELLNLVHRDLTPGNILLSFSGDVKIADFGLAKAKQRITKTLTGMPKGEPTYMAPEQARADTIDARADLFSLGIILFELFAGRRPWIAKTDYEMIQRISTTPPADLRELRPKIDKELVAIVYKCLEKDPAARFQSAREIGERLDYWLNVHGYMEDNAESLARFVRRNAMRQMAWFERAISGALKPPPRVGRALRPRVPTFNDETGRPVARPDTRSSAPTARDKPLTPTLDDAETAVTDAEWKIASRQAQGGAPVITTKGRPGDEGDWGEEVPTLVQKEEAAISALRSSARARPAPIFDEDSDQRITAVTKQINAVAPPPGAPLGPLGDLDSGEFPTEPVRRRGAPPARPPSVAPRPPTIPPAPIIPAAGARMRPPPPPAVPAAQPQRAPTFTSTDDAQVLDRRELLGPLTLDKVVGESDRLSIEAVRRGEEARAAAARAERLSAQAKMAADSARIAAEAAQFARSGNMVAAAQWLEEARKVEQLMLRNPNDPQAPASRMPSAAPPGAMPPQMPAPLATPVPASVPPPPSFFPEPMPPPSFPPPATGMRPPTFGEPPGSSMSFDASAFQGRLRPAIASLPPLALVGIAIVALCLVFLLFWAIFA